MASTICEITEDERATAIGFFNYANSYWISAFELQKLQITSVTHPSAPVDFLYVHAIELFLKSYLRLTKTVQELKEIGHSFEDLKQHCAGLFANNNNELVETLDMIAGHKINMLSRYICTGARNGYPGTERFQKLCTFLCNAIRSKMQEAGFPVR